MDKPDSVFLKLPLIIGILALAVVLFFTIGNYNHDPEEAKHWIELIVLTSIGWIATGYYFWDRKT